MRLMRKGAFAGSGGGVETATLEISSTGNTRTVSSLTCAYLSINGTIYTANGTYTVNLRDEVQIYGKTGSYNGKVERVGVKLNNNAVGEVTEASNRATFKLLYTYTFTSSTYVSFSLKSQSPQINGTTYVIITES